MNIILVSDSLAKSRIVTISQSQIIMAVMGFVSAGFMFALGTYWITMKYAVDIQNPFIQSLISTLTQQQTAEAEKDMREQLSSLAVKLGELQARLMRLDAFGDRLGKAAGHLIYLCRGIAWAAVIDPAAHRLPAAKHGI